MTRCDVNLLAPAHPGQGQEDAPSCPEPVLNVTDHPRALETPVDPHFLQNIEASSA